MDGRPVSRPLQQRSTERNTVYEMLPVVRYLMSAAQAPLLQVLGEEWANTVGKPLLTDRRDKRKCTLWGGLQDLLVLFQDIGHRLEVEAFEGTTVEGFQLDDVVLQSPFAALKRYSFVHLLEKFGNGRVVVEGKAEHYPGLGQTMTANYEPQTQAAAIHADCGTSQLLDAVRGTLRSNSSASTVRSLSVRRLWELECKSRENLSDLVSAVREL